MQLKLPRGEWGEAGIPGGEQGAAGAPEGEQGKSKTPGSGSGSTAAVGPFVGEVALLQLKAWDLGRATLSGPGAWDSSREALSRLRARSTVRAGTLGCSTRVDGLWRFC